MRKLSRTLALGLLLGGAGCHTYKYVDIPVSFDQATFDDAQIKSLVNICQMHVTGADSDAFRLPKCPNRGAADPHNAGQIEYSTFADSGTLNFTLDVYTGSNETADCKVGTGMIAVPVTSAMTIMAPNLIITKTGPGCPTNVTPPTDGGM